MTTECNGDSLVFQPLGRRAVVGRFDGGKITSDAGALPPTSTDAPHPGPLGEGAGVSPGSRRTLLCGLRSSSSGLRSAWGLSRPHVRSRARRGCQSAGRRERQTLEVVRSGSNRTRSERSMTISSGAPSGRFHAHQEVAIRQRAWTKARSAPLSGAIAEPSDPLRIGELVPIF